MTQFKIVTIITITTTNLKFNNFHWFAAMGSKPLCIFSDNELFLEIEAYGNETTICQKIWID